MRNGVRQKRKKETVWKTSSSKLHEQTVFRHIIRKAPARSLQPHHPRRFRRVPQSRYGYRTARKSGMHVRAGTGRSDNSTCQSIPPSFRHAVHHRGGIPSITITPHVVCPQGVNVKHNYTHCFFSPFYFLCILFSALTKPQAYITAPNHFLIRISDGVVW